MKKRLLSAATVVVMTFICLTGCSQDITIDFFEKAASKYGMRELDSLSSLYTIRYMSGSVKQLLCGTYLNENTVIYVWNVCDIDSKNTCAHSFFRSLGLVSPLTLKKKGNTSFRIND